MTNSFQNRRKSKIGQSLGRLAKRLWIGWDLTILVIGYLALLGPTWIIFSQSGSYPRVSPGPEDFAWSPPDHGDWWNWLGTDGHSISLLFRILQAASVSLWAAVLATGAGAIAGFGVAAVMALTFREWGYRILVRLTDVVSGVPAIVLALIGFVGAGAGFWVSVTIFSALIAVFVAGRTAYRLFDLEIEGDVLVARGLGVSRLRLFKENLLLRLMPGALSWAAGWLPAVLMAEAALSFAGFGLGNEVPNLGRLIAEGRAVMFEAPWLVIYPGLALWMLALVLAILGWSVRRTAREKLAPLLF